MSERLSLIRIIVDRNLLFGSQDHEHVGVCEVCQFSRGKVFFNNSAGALEPVRLFEDRDAASAACDDDLACFDKSVDRVDLYNINRLRAGYDTSESLSGIFDDIVALCLFRIGFFPRKTASDHFDGMIECIVIGVNDYLCDDR